MTTSSEWSVAEWLTSFGMKELTPKFLEHGYETEKLCSKLQEEDMEAMCISNPMHLEVIYTQSEMLRKKREEKTAVANGQAPAFLPKPLESTDGTSPNLHLVKHKVRKSPVVQQRKIPEKVHVPPCESQRTFAGYTKLQLKLKIKEEIRKEHIVLSEPPYCLEDGSANEDLLQDLAEDYAERFNLESLTVYYALKDVWRFTANEKSEIAIPMSGELKKVRKPADTPQPPELDTYSEPFDNKLQSPVKPMGKPAKKVAAVSGSLSPKNPPASFQAISELPGTYADPFDALPQITKDSPPSAEMKKRKPILSSPKSLDSSPGKSRDDSNIKWKVSPKPMNKTHSFTLPPPGSPSISSSSSEDSPKKSPRSRWFWSPFRRRKNASSSTSQSPQHQQELSKPQAVVHGSMEDLPKQKPPARVRQSSSQNRISRQSLPGALSGLPRITTDSGLISDSASEDSPIPAKKLSGSCGMLIDSGHDTPPIAGAGSSPTGSLGEERERVVSRVKALAIKRSNSDFELSNVVELYVEGQDRPFRFKKAQSTDELDKDESSGADGSGKKKKTSNIISRLFKPKSRKDKLKAVGNKTKSQSVSDDLITPSRSMPNVSRAVAVIHSEYTEVFDGDVRGKVAKTPSPSPSPRVPQRNRPHTTKPHRTTSTHSPKTSPPTHHRLMVKSDSVGSSEMTIHSIPTSKDDNDATIELRVPVSLPPSVHDSHADLEEEEDFGDVFQSSDAEKSPERDPSQTRTDVGGSASTKDGQRPVSIVRTCSGNKPPLAPKPVIARERLTSGNSLKRASRTSVESSTSTSPSHTLSPMEGHVDGSKPPPKPCRSKTRSLRSVSPSSSEGRSGEESQGPSVGGQLPHVQVVAAESTSSPPAGEDLLTVVKQPRQRWPSGSNPPPKPPKPLNLKGSLSLPRHLKPEVSPTLVHSVEKKLAEEGVDLSQAPYTNQIGEYNIPSGLVLRYVNEMDYSSHDVALCLEDIRRRLLHKHNQKYVPFVGSWKDHSSMDSSSVKAFLTSVGLPMYCSVFEEYGYSSVELIQSASPEQLFILPLTDRHRQLVSKALLAL